MPHLRSPLALACVLALSGCGHKTVFKRDALVSAQRWALLTVFSSVGVDHESVAALELPFADLVLATGRYASLHEGLRRAQEGIARGHHDCLSRQLGGTWLGLEEVSNAPGYRALPRKTDIDYSAPLGMGILDMEKPRALGAFARSLGVDGVVLVRHQFKLRRIGAITYTMDDRMTLVVMGQDDQVWWDVTEKFTGQPIEATSVMQALANVFDALTPDQAQQAMLDSSARALEHLMLPLRAR